jgi:hypothetical protein
MPDNDNHLIQIKENVEPQMGKSSVQMQEVYTASQEHRE